MLPMLLDPDNTDDYVWGDSAYAGACFEDLLNFAGFENFIYEKGSRNHLLSEAAKERNRIKSAIRACVKHVFGCTTMPILGGKMTRKIALERNNA